MVTLDHLSENELKVQLDEISGQVKVGETWFHYKDTNREKPYVIVAVGLLEESEEPCVVYQAQYGDKLIWVRTAEAFFSMVEVDGVSITRFSK